MCLTVYTTLLSSHSLIYYKLYQVLFSYNTTMAEQLTKQPPNITLLHQLAPTAEALYSRHLEKCKPWEPAFYIPYSHAKDFEPDYQWSPNEFPLDEGLRSALFVNLLTEDNLPYYLRAIDAFAGSEGIWGAWSGRWVAEENRHAIAIRGFIEASRILDVRKLDAARMAQMSLGKVPDPPTTADGIVYVAMQELATRVAHHNTGRLILEAYQNSTTPDLKALAVAGDKMLDRVGSDENFHYLFYRNLAKEGIKIDPSAFVLAIFRQIKDFEMPGTGIPGFAEHSKLIANAGVYNFDIHLKRVIKPAVLNPSGWDLEHISDLTPDAEIAREQIFKRISVMQKAIDRSTQQIAPKTSDITG
jgi:acyl-[acyl-carrier-protein] desaturase